MAYQVVWSPKAIEDFEKNWHRVIELSIYL